MRRDSLWKRMAQPARTPAVLRAGLPATTVRDAVQADRDALQRLAQLDSSTLPRGPRRARSAARVRRQLEQPT